jgi:superfamily II DNA/RNA helicase
VCSDVMARGIDLEGRLDNVMSYDVPTYAKTYINRAGRECVAISLCEEKQVENFLKIVKEAEIEGLMSLVFPMTS